MNREEVEVFSSKIYLKYIDEVDTLLIHYYLLPFTLRQLNSGLSGCCIYIRVYFHPFHPDRRGDAYIDPC